MLTIETANGQIGFSPGTMINGHVGWQLDHAPKKAVFRLFWYTEGRGTQDVGVIEETEIHVQQTQHEQAFQYQLPMEPYSFQSKLITLKWALELIVDKEVSRLDLTVSPWTEPLVLKEKPDDGKKPVFSINS